ALDYAEDGPLYERYWVHNQRKTHVIGKGIVRFHAVYWPAMLLSAGVPLPSDIFVHGYVTVDGAKIGKSLGNAVDPTAVVEEFGAEALRYYLLREVPAAGDGDFTAERLLRAYNNDLADRLGNLLNRAVQMVARYYDGVVPEPVTLDAARPEDDALIETARALPEAVAQAMEVFEPHVALTWIWRLVDAANRYVEQTEPWLLAKRRRDAGATGAKAQGLLATTLYTLVEALRLIGYLCQPFLPETAEGIARQLGLDPAAGGAWPEATRWGAYPAGTRVRPGGVLFPKREERKA
ncbi:MAG: class I tRNA ligase family protein, partial [Ktedonobacterales bacterium]